MRHADSAVLDAIEPLLAEIRALPGLTERRRGVFYRRSSAFLHFHEDPAGIFADVKGARGWMRFKLGANGRSPQLVKAARAALDDDAPVRRSARS